MGVCMWGMRVCVRGKKGEKCVCHKLDSWFCTEPGMIYYTSLAHSVLPKASPSFILHVQQGAEMSSLFHNHHCSSQTLTDSQLCVIPMLGT